MRIPLTDTSYRSGELDGKCVNILPELDGPAERLYKRAWVVQEKLLSTRILKYTDKGIRWRCRKVAHRMPRVDGVALTPEDWETLLETKVTELSRQNLGDKQERWMNILNRYNSSRLTYESDLRQALQGVISTLETETGMTFAKGVYVDLLPNSLLWALDSEPGRTRGMVRMPNDRKHTYEVWKSSISLSPTWSCTYR